MRVLRFHYHVRNDIIAVHMFYHQLFIQNMPFLLIEDVSVSEITLTSAVVSWKISSFVELETYTVEYGLISVMLNQVSAIVDSVNDTSATNTPYSITLQGLDVSTVYYLRVKAQYGVGGVYTRYSDVIAFFTQQERK